MNALLTTDTFGVPGIVVDARSWQFLASGVSEVRQREPWSQGIFSTEMSPRNLDCP